MKRKSSPRIDSRLLTRKLKRMKKLLASVIIVGIIAFGAWFWWQQGLTPVNKNDKTPVMFVVPKGAGIREIANNLKDQGLIRDDVVFFLYVRKNGIDKKIQAGDFRLNPSMTGKQIAKALTMGSIDIWVTVPEGKRAEEVAEILKEAMPTYDDTWTEELVQHEGYLFPDTYLIPRDATIEQIVSLMRNTFDARYAEIENKTNLTDQEIVILASMIEREARHDEDRPLVSSVMHNRLAIGMPLQIDATVQYALGYDTGERTWWKKGLTLEDLKLQSLYNTYARPGLPPGPIASPGLAVLKAAANPADTDYLYYITDKSGTNRYARTGEEHNRNIERYGL